MSTIVTYTLISCLYLYIFTKAYTTNPQNDIYRCMDDYLDGVN